MRSGHWKISAKRSRGESYAIMEKETLRFIILSIILFGASVMQFLGITLFGVVPNFVLAVIIVSALFLGDVWHELLLLSVASFLLKFSPTIEREIVAFFVVGLLISVGARRLPWHLFINGIFIAASATILLYALIDPRSIVSLMFVQELMYTVVLVFIAYHGLTSLRLFRNVS